MSAQEAGSAFPDWHAPEYEETEHVRKALEQHLLSAILPEEDETKTHFFEIPQSQQPKGRWIIPRLEISTGLEQPSNQPNDYPPLVGYWREG